MKPLLFCTLFHVLRTTFIKFSWTVIIYVFVDTNNALYENLLIPVKLVKKAIFHEMD